MPGLSRLNIPNRSIFGRRHHSRIPKQMTASVALETIGLHDDVHVSPECRAVVA